MARIAHRKTVVKTIVTDRREVLVVSSARECDALTQIELQLGKQPLLVACRDNEMVSVLWMVELEYSVVATLFHKDRWRQYSR